MHLKEMEEDIKLTLNKDNFGKLPQHILAPIITLYLQYFLAFIFSCTSSAEYPKKGSSCRALGTGSLPP